MSSNLCSRHLKKQILKFPSNERMQQIKQKMQILPSRWIKSNTTIWRVLIDDSTSQPKFLTHISQLMKIDKHGRKIVWRMEIVDGHVLRWPMTDRRTLFSDLDSARTAGAGTTGCVSGRPPRDIGGGGGGGAGAPPWLLMLLMLLLLLRVALQRSNSTFIW